MCERLQGYCPTPFPHSAMAISRLPLRSSALARQFLHFDLTHIFE
jgi:hypothetical protein